MKLTALESFLLDLDNLFILSKDQKGSIYLLYKEHKKIEEGQIALAYSKGTLDGVNKNFTNGYTYYKKTYGKDA